MRISCPFNIPLFLPYDPLPGKGVDWDHQTKGFSIFGLDIGKGRPIQVFNQRRKELLLRIRGEDRPAKRQRESEKVSLAKNAYGIDRGEKQS
jgi:hypothetical protein